MQHDDNSYFSVSHHFNAYFSEFGNDRPIPSEEELQQMQSIGLKLMSEVKAQEANCLLQLRQLDSETKAVVDYLKLQSRKIDLVLQYVLENERQSGTLYHGIQFGGSGFQVQSPNSFVVEERMEVNLYMREELIAILCIAEVVGCHPSPDGQGYLIDFSFLQILDADVESLVKASLSVQQKQLKARKEARSR